MKVIRDLTRYKTSLPLSLTIGKFDGLHLGHQRLLRRTAERAEADGLIPAVMTIDGGQRSLLTTKEREEMLNAFGMQLHFSCTFSEQFQKITPEEFVKDLLKDTLSVKALQIGDDFRFGYQRAGNAERLGELGPGCGFSVEVIPEVSLNGERISSTAVRQALAEGDFSRTNAMLGYRYAVRGAFDTIHDPERGRVLRMLPDPEKLLPPDGAYAASAFSGGESSRGQLLIRELPGVTGKSIRAALELFPETQSGGLPFSRGDCMEIFPEKRLGAVDGICN